MSWPYYSEGTRFVVNDADVSGLELKAFRGSTVSGVVIAAGVTDLAIKSKLQQSALYVSILGDQDPATANPGNLPGRRSNLSPDGGFRFTGVPPGKLMFLYLEPANHDTGRIPFTFNRIERDGAPVSHIIEIGRGEQVENLRIFVDYANGSIRGQVKIVGGDLPQGWRLKIYASRIGASEAKKCEIPNAVSATMAEARQSFVEEITLRALYAEMKPGATNQYLWPRESRYGSVPNSKGEFTLRGLSAGRYFLAANLPDDNWYVRAISIPAPASASSRRAAATAKKPAESGSSGITVKSGEKLSSVELNVSEGAAALHGKIVPAAETDKAPSRIRIHLIPAEVSSANDVLRYAEMITGADRKFEFNNIAPGKYWLLTKPAVENDQERPAAWDPIERAKLRLEAAAGKNEIELQPCQRVKYLESRFIPTS